MTESTAEIRKMHEIGITCSGHKAHAHRGILLDRLEAAEANLEKTSELISLYFEGCDCDEFDDRVRELRAALEAP